MILVVGSGILWVYLAQLDIDTCMCDMSDYRDH